MPLSGNPLDDIPCVHGIVRHDMTELRDCKTPRSVDEFIEFAKTFMVEGIVYKHPKTGELFKFRCDMIPGSKFKQTIKKKGKTDIRLRC